MCVPVTRNGLPQKQPHPDGRQVLVNTRQAAGRRQQPWGLHMPGAAAAATSSGLDCTQLPPCVVHVWCACKAVRAATHRTLPAAVHHARMQQPRGTRQQRSHAAGAHACTQAAARWCGAALATMAATPRPPFQGCARAQAAASASANTRAKAECVQEHTQAACAGARTKTGATHTTHVCQLRPKAAT